MKHKLKLKASSNPPINKKETMDYVPKGQDQIETVLKDIMDRSKRSLAKNIREIDNDDIRHIQLCKSFYSEMSKAGQQSVVARLDTVLKNQHPKATFGDFLNNVPLNDIVEHNQNGTNRCGMISNNTLFTVEDFTLSPEDVAYLTRKNVTRTTNLKTGNTRNIGVAVAAGTAAGAVAGTVAGAVAGAATTAPKPTTTTPQPAVVNKSKNMNWILWLVFFLLILLIVLVSLVIIRKRK